MKIEVEVDNGWHHRIGRVVSTRRPHGTPPLSALVLALVVAATGLPAAASAAASVADANGDTTAPRFARVDEIIRGLCNGNCVRTEGNVIDAYYDDIDTHYAFIVLRDGASVLYGVFGGRPPMEELRALIGARVAIVGTCSRPKFSRPYVSCEISFKWPSGLTVLAPPPADFFAVPDLFDNPLDTLHGYDRRRTRGRVLATWGGDKLILRTPDGKAALVAVAADALPPVGAGIEAVGYPDTDMYNRSIHRADWRFCDVKVPEEEAPEAIPLYTLFYDKSGKQRFDVFKHGRTVRLRGNVCGISDTTGQRSIMLNDEHAIIQVYEGAATGAFGKLAVGCTVEVAGTCVLDIEPFRPQSPMPRIRDAFVVLRAPADLNVLARPPWWTPGRLLSLLGLMAVGILAITFWNRHLRHCVELRSRELLDEQIAHVTSDLKTVERTRLAIELHDSIAQNLTGVALELQTAREAIGEDPALSARHLAVADRSLASCREELRNCLRDLRCDALEMADVNQAIRTTLSPHVGNTGVSVRFNVPRDHITDNTMHALLRIIRELVLNAVRHGKATAIKVAGAIESGQLLFSVSDNGCGFDVAARPGVREGHFGLQGIRERINLFGGSMEITSEPGRGTKATIALRLPRDDKK